MKKILILGPLWRNKKILNFLRKDYTVISYNKKINVSFIKKQKIDILITSVTFFGEKGCFKAFKNQDQLTQFLFALWQRNHAKRLEFL